MNKKFKLIVTSEGEAKKLTKAENNKLQRQHDKAMAVRFGFRSLKKMNQYIAICNKNPKWFEDNGGMHGVLNNIKLVRKFLRNKTKFELEIVNCKTKTFNGLANGLTGGGPGGTIFVTPGRI